METEGKQGSNHVLLYGLNNEKRDGDLIQCQMQGFYILPNLRYDINSHHLSSLQLSCRYEYFDPDFKHSSNSRQTYTPMLSAEFLKSYQARIHVGASINIYDYSIPGTAQYNNHLLILQIQSRL